LESLYWVKHNNLLLSYNLNEKGADFFFQYINAESKQDYVDVTVIILFQNIKASKDPARAGACSRRRFLAVRYRYRWREQAPALRKPGEDRME
jgi:hypothetical protein